MNQFQITQHAQERHWDCREWLANLFSKLYVARGMRIDEERKLGLAAMLLDADFTESQSATAEAWILIGDWSLKGKDAELTYQDFYPTSDQNTRIAHTNARGATKSTLSDRDNVLANLRARRGSKPREVYANQLQAWIEQGLVSRDEFSERVTDKGIYLYSLKYESA